MARSRSRGAFSLTRTPSISSSPAVMSSSPTIMRSSVDFPQPDGPTRMTNSPSAMSRLTPFTARKPSPYCLTMSLRVMAAIGSPSWDGLRAWTSALDGALGQAGHDLAVEEQDEDDHRDGHDDGRGGDRSRRLLELRGTGEERQRGGHGSGAVGRRERDAVDEVVPGDEERDQRGGEHPGCGERHDRLAEGLPRGRAVHLRGLLELPRDLSEERREGPDGDRQ